MFYFFKFVKKIVLFFKMNDNQIMWKEKRYSRSEAKVELPSLSWRSLPSLSWRSLRGLWMLLLPFVAVTPPEVLQSPFLRFLFHFSVLNLNGTLNNLFIWTNEFRDKCIFWFELWVFSIHSLQFAGVTMELFLHRRIQVFPFIYA